MNNKVKKTYMAVWVVFLPVSVLLVMIFILLYNFGLTSKKAAKSVVENDLLVKTEDLAFQIHEELGTMTRIGMAFRDMLLSMSINDQKDKLKMIGTLCNNSNSYMVVYTDKEGIGFTHNGIKVNVKKDNLFFKEDKEQYYAYLKKDSIMQAEAIVSVIPIVNDDIIEGYILMYYSVSHIRKLYEKNIQYDNSFLVFSVDNGVVITSKGLVKRPESDEMLLKYFMESNPKVDFSLVKKDLLATKGTSFFGVFENNYKYVICTPVQIKDWYITVGYDNRLYEKMLTNEWYDIKKLITYLLVLICVFLVFMLGTTAIIYIFYNKHNKKLQVAADTDLLTNLYNKVTTENKIKEYIAENKNVGAILFILDVDNFKEINDTKGHFAGDEVLKQLGEYLNEKIGNKNIIGRIGGDEFFVFIKDLKSEQDQVKETERIYHIFRAFSSQEKQITFSVGVAWYPKNANNFECLFEVADLALYEAKKNGKNQMILYNGK